MSKKAFGLIELLAYYLLSFGLGFLSYPFLRNAGVSYLASLLICDVITTVLIFFIGIFKKTASVYDPYWSVQTFFACLIAVSVDHEVHPIQLLVFIPLLFYSIRLTWHFATTFTGFDYVDWRYQNLREKSGHYFQLVSFFGIQLFPTLLVFAASVPILLFARYGGGAFEEKPVLTTTMTILFFVFASISIFISLTSDLTMSSFIRKRSDRAEVCQQGLWGYSRHPNYLGEIGFWASGIFLLPLFHPAYLLFIAAPLAILALFLFYSIPAIEEHMVAHKPLYEVYQKEVSMLLILPRKKRKRLPEDYNSK